MKDVFIKSELDLIRLLMGKRITGLKDITVYPVDGADAIIVLDDKFEIWIEDECFRIKEIE